MVDPLNDLKMGYLQVHQNSLLRDEDKNEAEFESHEAVISETGMPREWVTMRLKMLPKKGDLHDLNNWRGIMLLDAGSKILP